MRKRKYSKRRKRDRWKAYIRKKKVYFGRRRSYLRKNNIHFGGGIKRTQRGIDIIGTIFTKALPLVGEIVKSFK